jgi:hypothetical protein
LQLKRDEVKVKLHGISFASDDEWEGLKTGTEHALGEVRTMLHEAISKINNLSNGWNNMCLSIRVAAHLGKIDV